MLVAGCWSLGVKDKTRRQEKDEQQKRSAKEGRGGSPDQDTERQTEAACMLREGRVWDFPKGWMSLAPRMVVVLVICNVSAEAVLAIGYQCPPSPHPFVPFLRLRGVYRGRGYGYCLPACLGAYLLMDGIWA